MEATTARILDRRRILKKNAKYRLAIRVTFDRKHVPFPLDLYVSEEDFKKLSSPRLGKELAEIRDKFIEEENRAREIIRNIGTFAFDAFREEFHKNNITYKRKKTRQREALIAQTEKEAPISPSPLEGRNRKYGKRKYDHIRSNINYEQWGPLAIAFGEYIKLLEAQERIGSSESYFTALMSLLKFKKKLTLRGYYRKISLRV